MSAVLGAAAARSRPGALRWSEYGFVLALLAAAAVTVDPFDWRLASHTLLKHLALALALGFALLTAVGRRLRAPLGAPSAGSGVLRVAWPLLVLAALIMGGSLYERGMFGVRDTFLDVGLYMLTLFVAADMVCRSDAPLALVRACFAVLLPAALVMGVLLVANFGVRQVYHEQIFLVIPLAVLCLAPARRSALCWLGGLFFLAMAWFSQKYTSYLVGALTAAYLLGVVALPRSAARPGLERLTAAYWTALLALAAAGLVVLAMLAHRADLPTGNPGYRLHTYAQAWERFTGSPLFGTLFAAEAVHKFTLYSIGIARNRLPTHSDVLDLLANGGVLGVSLWALGLARIARVSARELLAPRFLGRPEAPYGHALAMISIAGILTYAFNPILLQPPKAFLLWASLGLLLGLALAQRERGPGRPAPATSGTGNTKRPRKTRG
ncbi:MAG: hypothetical protein M0015_01450 [Betaproteobacteria bacterium]|nr:hypothetical protein [Betaproteobacteria bacterium]